MTMMNWDPWRDLADMRSIYNRVFGDGAVARVASEGPAAVSSIYMPVDVSETADKYVLKAEMPGMNADDIEITVADNQVTLKGSRNESKEEKGTNYVRSERRFGSFSRSFSLGVPVDSSKVEATYRNGVLEVELPKLTTALPRQIKVRADMQ